MDDLTFRLYPNIDSRLEYNEDHINIYSTNIEEAFEIYKQYKTYLNEPIEMNLNDLDLKNNKEGGVFLTIKINREDHLYPFKIEAYEPYLPIYLWIALTNIISISIYILILNYILKLMFFLLICLILKKINLKTLILIFINPILLLNSIFLYYTCNKKTFKKVKEFSISSNIKKLDKIKNPINLIKKLFLFIKTNGLKKSFEIYCIFIDTKSDYIYQIFKSRKQIFFYNESSLVKKKKLLIAQYNIKYGL